MDEKGLKVLIGVSLVMAFGGLFYLFSFSSILGNEFPLSPTGDSGVRLSPGDDLQKVCEIVNGNEVFVSCLATSQDPLCNIRRFAVSPDGSVARSYLTLCSYANCVC